MASLVADYGTSSSSESNSDDISDDADNTFKEEEEEEDDDEEEENNENNEICKTASKEKLPLPTPDFNGIPTMKTSVFSNPFVEAEKAKSAILEKHVKMTPTLDDTKMINATELETIRTPQETIICQTPYNGQVSINDDDEIDQENNQMNRRKKRPGLSQSLIPSKKVLKMYKAQQAKAISR
ncbi:yemanuclein isoform X2 [Apis dorsata]|uniref:yemanuclein isoform X2 n=1 Tax=Apis dorsata TaxID=7462 RepID=UPI0012935233|nr:yemanuclein isoform X2 [Apis dorsata]